MECADLSALCSAATRRREAADCGCFVGRDKSADESGNKLPHSKASTFARTSKIFQVDGALGFPSQWRECSVNYLLDGPLDSSKSNSRF